MLSTLELRRNKKDAKTKRVTDNSSSKAQQRKRHDITAIQLFQRAEGDIRFNTRIKKRKTGWKNKNVTGKS